MATLTGRAPSATYKGILNIDNADGLDGTLRVIQDGEGTTGPIQLSTAGVRVESTATVDFESGATLDASNATLAGLLGSLADDTTPQAGGDIDMNAFDIQFDDATGIRDDSDNEQLIFQKTASAVNHFKMTNAAAGGNPLLAAVGDDTDIHLDLVAKGTGDLRILDPADQTKIVQIIPSAITTGNTRTLTMADANVDLADVNTAYQQGKETIFVPVAAMRPTVSNGCSNVTTVETTAGRPDMVVMDFDASADEHAQFQVAFPKKWNAGTITYQVYWTTTGADTDGVTWGLQGVAVSDNETIDVAYGTAVRVDDAIQSAAEELLVTAESSAVTIGGTPAAGDMVFFRIFRDVSYANDTATEDARLIGIRLFFTTNANDDT